MLPIDVEQLPPATTWLNYPGDCENLLGRYLGPNAMGEHLTVVVAECNDASGEFDLKPKPMTRVGLAYGCYTVNGEPTDPDGLPPGVALSKLQADWQSLKTPGIAVPQRAGKPTRIVANGID